MFAYTNTHRLKDDNTHTRIERSSCARHPGAMKSNQVPEQNRRSARRQALSHRQSEPCLSPAAQEGKREPLSWSGCAPPEAAPRHRRGKTHRPQSGTNRRGAAGGRGKGREKTVSRAGRRRGRGWPDAPLEAGRLRRE